MEYFELVRITIRNQRLDTYILNTIYDVDIYNIFIGYLVTHDKVAQEKKQT